MCIDIKNLRQSELLFKYVSIRITKRRQSKDLTTLKQN